MATVEAPQRQPGYLAVQEKAKLRKVLRRFDLVLFTACAIVGLDTVAFAASIGGEAITWLVGLPVLFLIPYGVFTAEVATAIAALNAFVFKHSISKWPEIGIGLAFTWVTVIIAVIAFRYGKWGPNIGTLIKTCVVGIFFVLVIAFLISKGQ